MNAKRLAPLALFVAWGCSHPHSAPAGLLGPRIFSLKSVDVLDAAPGATSARPIRLHLEHSNLRATLLYPEGKRAAVPAMRFRVMLAGRVVHDGTIQQMPADLRILTAENGRVIAIADTYSGGAHCCYGSAVVDATDPGAPRYVKKDWGNLTYDVVQSRDATGYVFVTGDNAGAYAFGSYAESAFPVLVESYRNGVFVDVSKEYPDILATDAAEQWHEYALGRRSNVAPEAALAAYLADEYRLGRSKRAWARVHALHGLPKDFDAKAMDWLRSSGYVK
ncbi:MAG: hypothetical protein JO263_05900 [Candidatus Eremiobacteraeota bacterium]|nr:hypothetical protein [Candidatus Eremiobacteraeota bacterium]